MHLGAKKYFIYLTKMRTYIFSVTWFVENFQLFSGLADHKETVPIVFVPVTSVSLPAEFYLSDK